MSHSVFGETIDENLKEMEQWIGSLAVVTGASSGIGATVVRKLVKAGVIVVGLGRRLDALEELEKDLVYEKGTFHPKQCDITNDDEIFQTFEWIEDTLGPISILVNSAGVFKPTNLKEGDEEVWKTTFDVNVIGLCVCTREAVKSMKKHEVAGHIIHINGVVGHVIPKYPTPEPIFNVFPATKHAVRAITETLRIELNHENSKIKVSSVSPGLTETDLRNEFSEDEIQSLAEIPKLQAEDVAKAVMYILGTPPGVQVHDLIIRAVGEVV